MRCRIRKKEVMETPEELVRQHVLNHLIDDLHYPSSLISVEKALLHFNKSAPKRRLDILVFNEQLNPYLLIECKSHPLTALCFNQVQSYNFFVKAPLVALVNEREVRLAKRMQGEWVFFDRFPEYLT